MCLVVICVWGVGDKNVLCSLVYHSLTSSAAVLSGEVCVLSDHGITWDTMGFLLYLTSDRSCAGYLHFALPSALGDLALFCNGNRS